MTAKGPVPRRVSIFKENQAVDDVLVRLAALHVPWESIAQEINRQFNATTTAAACRSRMYEINCGRQRSQSPPPAANGQPHPVLDHSDKKIGGCDWRELSGQLKTVRESQKKSSWSQDAAKIDWSDRTTPITIVGLADFHMGSWGADLESIERITDELLTTPNLYAFILGDMVQMAINMRNVLEVSDNSLSPERQMDFLESWMAEVSHKVIAATWDNHAVMRQEKVAGYSEYKRLMNRYFTYCNGIGHVDVTLGTQTYKFALSHRFRGNSMYNPLHAQGRYRRMEANDRHAVWQGDTHIPGFSYWAEGGSRILALNAGSTQTDSGYAKRHFSLTTWDAFPCVEIWPEEFRMIPYWSVGHWLATTHRPNVPMPVKPATIPKREHEKAKTHRRPRKAKR